MHKVTEPLSKADLLSWQLSYYSVSLEGVNPVLGDLITGDLITGDFITGDLITWRLYHQDIWSLEVLSP